MTIQDCLIRELGSDAVYTHLALASTWDVFFQRALAIPAIDRLRAHLARCPADTYHLLNRAYDLWRETEASVYSSPRDIELAACLIALQVTDHAEVRDLAWRIHDQHSPNLFWARAAAAAIVLPSK